MPRRVGGRLGALGEIARGLRALTGSRSESARDARPAPAAQPASASVPPPSTSVPPPSVSAPRPSTSAPTLEPPASEALLDSARSDVATLLAEIEQVRPGLVRHRALDLDCGSGTLVHALGEIFDECDGLSHLDVGEEWALPFADETFDLVRCGTLPWNRDGGDAEHVIAETLRVLRLFGVAVMDFSGGGEPTPEPLPVPSASDRLELQLSAPERLPLLAGGRGELPVTVTNTGPITLGSAITPLRLEGHWNHHRDAGSTAGELELSGILLPGDSRAVTLPLAVADTPCAHVLELSVASPGPWGERRSPATTVVIDTAPRDGNQAVAPVRRDGAVLAALTQAGGVILHTLSLEPGPDALPRRRYFLARA